MIKSFQICRFLVLAALLASVAGCAQLNWNTTDWSKTIPWLEDDEPKTPEKVVAMWTDTVRYEAGYTPMRGFGGRLMFYDSKNDQPIKVDGTLVVYAFDENGRKPDNPKPDRKYIFTPEQFEEHYSKSGMGHSYSVWVPCSEAGGPPQEVSLIVRFVPSNGSGVVVGKQAKHMLPGVMPMMAEQPGSTPRVSLANRPTQSPATTTNAGYAAPQTSSTTRNIRPASHETVLSNSDGGRAESSQMRTATIAIPPQFGRRRSPIAATHTWPRSQEDRFNRPRSAPAGSAAPRQAAMPADPPPVPWAQAPSPTTVRRGTVPPGMALPEAAPPSGQPASPWGVRPAAYRQPAASAAAHQGAGQPPTHYSPSRSRTLGQPIVGPIRDHSPSQQSPATSPYRR